MKRGQLGRMLCAVTFSSFLSLSAGGTLAAANDPSGGQCDGLDPTGGLFSTCLRAHSAANRVEHLNAVGANETAIAKAKKEFDKAMATYAELSGGKTVPGFGAKAKEVILAVAYISKDVTPGYSAGDTLIAKLLDMDGNGVPSAGDLVVTSKYPTDLAGAGEGQFTVTDHTVVSVSADPTYVSVKDASNNTFIWGRDSDREYFQESDGSNTYLSQFYDAHTETYGGVDGLNVNSSSPSRPNTAVTYTTDHRPVDDAFVNIDFYFAAP